MKRYLTMIANFLRRTFSAGKGPVIHRQIAVVCPAHDTGSEILKQLQACTIADLSPLQGDVVPAAGSAQAVLGNPAATSAPRVLILVEAGRRRRLRRWKFTFWNGARDSLTEATACDRIDTMLICWPYALLASPHAAESELSAMTSRLTQLAADHRSLRHSAIVVTGVPSESGLLHPAQTRLSLPRRHGWRDGIDRILEQSVDMPGNGCADPRWRRFLDGTLARSRALAVIFETVRHAVGDDCMVFFLPERIDANSPQLLVEWIGKRNACRSRGSARASRVSWRLAGLATAFLIVASTIAALLPGPEASPIQLTSLPPSEQLNEVCDRACEYGDFSNRLFRSTAFGSITEIPDSLTGLATILRMQAHRAHVRLMTDSIVVRLDSMHTDKRDSTVTSVIAELMSQLDSLAIYESTFRWTEWNHIKETQLVAWRDELVRAAVLFAVGSCDLDSNNPICLIPPPIGFNPLIDRVCYTGTPDTRQLLEQMRSLRSLPKLYAIASEIVSDSRYDVSDSLISIILPPLPLDAIVTRFMSSDFSSVIRSGQDALLSSVVMLVKTNTIAAGNTSRDALADANTALSLWAEECKPSDLVVAFARVGDLAWHVDVSQDGSPTYVPARWQGNGTEAACLVRMENWQPSQPLTVRCNHRTALHSVAGSADLPCVAGNAITLHFSDTSGAIQFPVEDFKITYRIVDGWPQWPPEDIALTQGD